MILIDSVFLVNYGSRCVAFGASSRMRLPRQLIDLGSIPDKQLPLSHVLPSLLTTAPIL